MQRHQVDRKGKQPPAEIYFDVMAVMIERDKAIYKLPHAKVAGVEDVRAVAVNIDSLDPLGIAIAADVAPFIDQHYAAAIFRHYPRKHRAEHSAADDKVIEAHAIPRFVRGRQPIVYATAFKASGNSCRRNR